MSHCAKVTTNNPEHWESICKSFNPNQLESKAELAEHVMHWKEFTVLGGWYCNLLSAMCQSSQITSVDIDPVCKKIGEKMTNNVKYITADMFDYDIKTRGVVNPSTEHVDKDKFLVHLNKLPSGTIYIMQNNNMFHEPTHVNCFDTLKDFKEYVEEEMCVQSYKQYTMPNGFIRYTVKAIKP